MPVFIRDYTDFYSSKNHAMNMGIMFRGKDNALMPNWVHIPIGYHGRASSVVITGTEIIRPKGQVSADKVNPTWSKCNRMDYEVEMGLIVGKTNKLGQPVKITEAHDHIFGLCVVNDWSARDMQVWEYQPLGPFNAKNFATTISPWIVTMEALEPFKVPLSAQDPKPLDYLYEKDLYSYDVKLQTSIKTEKASKYQTLITSNLKYLYWSMNQQLTHHTVTGCNLTVGDLLASGTISGVEKHEYGSLTELTWGGKDKIQIEETGEERVFIQDGDSINMTGYCEGPDYVIGFGDCEGKILPALSDDNYF